MSAVPFISYCFVYPKNKTVAPFPATIVGYSQIAGLGVGGGPIEPPPDITPVPPLVIWGGGNEPFPTPPIFFPPEPPPDVPPTGPVQPPHEGWNWSVVKSAWYYLYIPGPNAPGPKV